MYCRNGWRYSSILITIVIQLIDCHTHVLFSSFIVQSAVYNNIKWGHYTKKFIFARFWLIVYYLWLDPHGTVMLLMKPHLHQFGTRQNEGTAKVRQ